MPIPSISRLALVIPLNLEHPRTAFMKPDDNRERARRT
jgi:hypothetical protein